MLWSGAARVSGESTHTTNGGARWRPTVKRLSRSAVVSPLAVDGVWGDNRHEQFLDAPDMISQFRCHCRCLPLPALLTDLHRKGERIHRTGQVIDPILPGTRRIQRGEVLGIRGGVCDRGRFEPVPNGLHLRRLWPLGRMATVYAIAPMIIRSIALIIILTFRDVSI